MSRPTRATPRSAGCSSKRIEIQPSRRAAIAWFAWIALVCLVTLCGVALPLAARIAVSALIAIAGVRTLRSFVLLRGPRAVRAISWSGASLRIEIGPERKSVEATLNPASFRPGRQWLALRFDTPAGGRQVLIDGHSQEPGAFRSLCREFSRGLKASTRRDSRTS